MERLDFIRKLFSSYGKSTEKNIDLIKEYDSQLSEYRYVDWDKMYRLVDNSDIKNLPDPRTLRHDFIPKCQKQIEGQYRYDNGNIVIVLKDDARKKRTGHNMFYVIPLWHETRTLEEIENLYKRKYGNSLLGFTYYPEEYSIIDNRIFDVNMQQCGVIE